MIGEFRPPAVRRPAKVLAWPAWKNRRDNPFQALLSDALVREGRPVHEFSLWRALTTRRAVWHWHWVDSQLANRRGVFAWFRYVGLRLLLLWARVLRVRIVVTAHNVRPHDAVETRLSGMWQHGLDRATSGVHYLSNASVSIVQSSRTSLASKPLVVTRHGHYREVIARQLDRNDARRALGVSPHDHVVLTFGKLRRYKGVFDLIDAFRDASTGGAHLVVAGAPETAELAAGLASIADDESLTVIPRYLDDDELAEVLAAADVVVLPYTTILNSGSALYALSANRPVVVPAVGSLLELEQEVGREWVRTFDGPLTATLVTELLAHSAPDGEPDLSAYEWASIARALDAFYESLF